MIFLRIAERPHATLRRGPEPRHRVPASPDVVLFAVSLASEVIVVATPEPRL